MNARMKWFFAALVGFTAAAILFHIPYVTGFLVLVLFFSLVQIRKQTGAAAKGIWKIVEGLGSAGREILSILLAAVIYLGLRILVGQWLGLYPSATLAASDASPGYEEYLWGPMPKMVLWELLFGGVSAAFVFAWWRGWFEREMAAIFIVALVVVTLQLVFPAWASKWPGRGEIDGFLARSGGFAALIAVVALGGLIAALVTGRLRKLAWTFFLISSLVVALQVFFPQWASIWAKPSELDKRLKEKGLGTVIGETLGGKTSAKPEEIGVYHAPTWSEDIWIPTHMNGVAIREVVIKLPAGYDYTGRIRLPWEWGGRCVFQGSVSSNLFILQDGRKYAEEIRPGQDKHFDIGPPFRVAGNGGEFRIRRVRL